MASDVLLEIGVEELPASFVKDAVDALPSALKSTLDELRLSHGDVRAAGTPRRLSVWALDVADGAIRGIASIVNPDKLRHIATVGSMVDTLRSIRDRRS